MKKARRIVNIVGGIVTAVAAVSVAYQVYTHHAGLLVTISAGLVTISAGLAMSYMGNNFTAKIAKAVG